MLGVCTILAVYVLGASFLSCTTKHLPAFATLFDGAATADGSETGNQAVVATATTLATGFLLRRSLLVLHGSLALRRTILTLGRTILALRGTVLTLRGAVALQNRKKQLVRFMDLRAKKGSLRRGRKRARDLQPGGAGDNRPADAGSTPG